MKKLLTIGLLVATTLALALTSCKNNVDLPGNWTKDAQLTEGEVAVYGVGKLTVSGLTATYELQPSALAANYKNRGENIYFANPFTLTKEKNYTGCKVDVTSNCKGGFGIVFNCDSTPGAVSYYRLQINANGYYYIEKIANDSETPVKDWDKNDAICKAPQKNSIVIYKEKKDIAIQVNGTEIFRIKDAELTSGSYGVTCNIGHQDIVDDVKIKSEFKFKEFQY